VGGNISQELFACHNCENRMVIDRVVLEKNWVAVNRWFRWAIRSL